MYIVPNNSSNNISKNILVVGAGSIGVYLGTLLSNKNYNVTLLGRDKLKKINDTILIGEDIFNLPNQEYLMPKDKKFDFIFITSKLYDLENNLKELKNQNVQTHFLVSIQNGLVDNSLYEPYIKNKKFTSISVYKGFRLLDNQLFVNQSKSGWKTDNSEASIKTANILQDSGINCTSEYNLDSLKAEKTIMNCCVNVLSAVKKKTFFELYNNNNKTKKMMDDLFDESYNILNRVYDLKPKNELKSLFYDVIKPMKHYSSTYQDANSGKKTEVNFLNGLVIKLGHELGIPSIANNKIVNDFNKMYF